tara:strand:+ start:7432 stop:7629 length:198 start_codon:yes stop_codon:yes gene_type:complete
MDAISRFKKKVGGRMNERIEKVNSLVNIFCKDQVNEEYLSKNWVNNLILLQTYSTELLELWERME